MSRILNKILAAALATASGIMMFEQGCGVSNADCIGADGYNWCLAGSWDGQTIHEPSVQPFDFTD